MPKRYGRRNSDRTVRADAHFGADGLYAEAKQRLALRWLMGSGRDTRNRLYLVAEGERLLCLTSWQ